MYNNVFMPLPAINITLPTILSLTMQAEASQQHALFEKDAIRIAGIHTKHSLLLLLKHSCS